MTVHVDGRMPPCTRLVAITRRIDTAGQRIDFGHAPYVTELAALFHQ
jgi:hypothetical protein